ncbi:MAG: FGGY family carbohydrate kinase [Sciscionella sp.]
MAVNELVIGVDIGTASSKGVLVDARGTVLARASRAHEVSTPHPGWVEHDAETVWWRDFLAITRELVGAADGRALVGLGVSGIGPTLLPADSAARPLRPAILYGVDTRAGRQITELTEELGEQAILARGGSVLTSQAVGPKIRWLAENEPETYGRTDMLLMCSSYLVHRLTGRYVLDHHSASQATPLYDLTAREWATDWAAAVAPGITLPELRWPTEVAGTVTIVSDVTGVEQQVAAETAGACLGDAMLAAGAVGLVDDTGAWNPVVDTVRPDPDRAPATRATTATIGCCMSPQ